MSDQKFAKTFYFLGVISILSKIDPLHFLINLSQTRTMVLLPSSIPFLNSSHKRKSAAEKQEHEPVCENRTRNFGPASQIGQSGTSSKIEIFPSDRTVPFHVKIEFQEFLAQ